MEAAFDRLVGFLDTGLDDAERRHFFDVQVPLIAAAALRLPHLKPPTGVHYSLQQQRQYSWGFFSPLNLLFLVFFLIGLPFSSGGCRLRSHHPDCSGVVYDLLGSTEFEKSHKQYGPKPISGNDSASAKYSFFLGGWGGRLIQSWLKSRKAEDRVFFPSK